MPRYALLAAALVVACAPTPEDPQEPQAAPAAPGTVQRAPPASVLGGTSNDPVSEGHPPPGFNPGLSPASPPVYPDGGPAGNDPNDCHRTSDCAQGETCWWDWAALPRTGRDVCAALGSSTMAGCITAAMCEPGLFCVYSECNDPNLNAAEHQSCVDQYVAIGQASNAGKGCCSTFSDHCS